MCAPGAQTSLRLYFLSLRAWARTKSVHQNFELSDELEKFYMHVACHSFHGRSVPTFKYTQTIICIIHKVYLRISCVMTLFACMGKN